MTTLEIVHRDPSSYTCTLERVQHRFTRITGGFSSLLYAKRLLRLALWPVEERRYRCDLIEVFKMFYGYTEIDKRVLFTLDGNDKGLCGHSKKICKPRLNTDIRKYFFSNRVIDRWNSVDQDTVHAPSLNCFKNRLNKIRCTKMSFFVD